MNHVRTIVTVAALVGIAMPSLAQDPVSRTVRYADLNLASAEGRAVLDGRLRQAIRAVCGSVDKDRDLAVAADVRACRDKARAGANRQLARLAKEERLASLALAPAKPRR